MPRAGAELEPDGESTTPVLDFEELYRRLWRPMLRIATGLVDDVALAEEVVQEAFTALFERRSRLRDSGAAAGYLRVCVVNAARSVLRRRRTARRHLHAVYEDSVPGADDSTMLSADHAAARQALVDLPERQREVLTLRYLADLSDDDIAAATGLSLPGVRSAASRGLAALRTNLGGLL